MSAQLNLEEIINLVKKGDKHAFRQLVEIHQQYAFSLAFRIICDEEESKDAVQESFIKIWRNISKYDSHHKFTTWMYKIVTNTALDHLRVIKRKSTIELDTFNHGYIANENYHFEKQIENKELAQMILFLSDGLSEKQRSVFVLRDLEGLPSTEVQEILEMKETSVKSNLYHARKIVRKKLQNIMTYERRVI